MMRYERKEQIGETVWLHGAFAAVGVLSKSGESLILKTVHLNPF